MHIKLVSLFVFAFIAMASFTGLNPAIAETPVWTKGEVTKVDKELGKVTVRHEEIKNLDMPPMRMIFRVADPKLLDEVKVGQKGEFYFVDQNGRMMIKQIR